MFRILQFCLLLHSVNALSSVAFPSAQSQSGIRQPGRMTGVGELEKQRERSTTNSVYVIRSCSRDDLSAVSSLLAEVTIEYEDAVVGFRAAMQVLQAKAEFKAQLTARLSCIEAGHSLMNGGAYRRDYDCSRQFWSNDAFRRKVELAAGKTLEASGFKRHDFAITPSSDLLQHAMFVVREQSEVVGFCEVAMLTTPANGRIDDDSHCVQPMIMNLAISPSHRCRGLANRLTQSALRYTQRYFCADKNKSMGLYVNEDNENALRLYRRNGFQIQAAINDQYYMKCSLDTCNYAEESRIFVSQETNVLIGAF